MHIEIRSSVDAQGKPLYPNWTLIGAGRAAEALREDWRRQLEEAQAEIGFDYIRFHGIFHDDMMICQEGNTYFDDSPAKNATPYNWTYVDEVFDFLLDVGIRPIVEFGFMPSALASGEKTIFWWKGHVTPPEDWQKWDELVHALMCHWINRYGREELRAWYYEVWNEPDLPTIFWAATQQDYFTLYRHTVNVIKALDEEFMVGGPATSSFNETEHGREVPWMKDFLTFCKEENLPVDFVSSHPYPTSWSFDEGTKKNKMGYRGPDSTLNDITLLKETMKEAGMEEPEIHITEWNSSPRQKDLVKDTAFMAPYVIKNSIDSLGLVDSLGFWTFTDIFEENKIGDAIFHGGMGMITVNGLKKASYYGYWFLSRLGEEIVDQGEQYIVTKSPDDMFQVLVWHYCHYDERLGSGDVSVLTHHNRYDGFRKQDDLTCGISLALPRGDYRAIQYEFGRHKGNVFDTWVANGAPDQPDEQEMNILQKYAGPEARIEYLYDTDRFERPVTLAPHDVCLIELSRRFS
jgi:xylan 1,4-beta-xylosidase